MQSPSLLMTLLATTAALWGVPAHTSARDAQARADSRRAIAATSAASVQRSQTAVLRTTATVWPRRSPEAVGRAFVRPR
jgi:hypothetical protein